MLCKKTSLSPLHYEVAVHLITFTFFAPISAILLWSWGGFETTNLLATLVCTFEHVIALIYSRQIALMLAKKLFIEEKNLSQ